MPRYRKGTTDHDNDGRMGGSMKEDDMVKVKGAGPKDKTVKKVAPKVAEPKVAAKTPAKAEKPAEPKQPKGPTQAEIEAADLEASVGRHPGGMEPPLSEAEAKARLEAEFAEADARGDPRWNELQAGLAVRGY